MSRTTPRAISVSASRLTMVCLPYLRMYGAEARPSPAMTILLVVASVSQPSRVLAWLSSAMAELDVVGDEGVEDGVRDLVADLVRMAFGNRFAGEEIVLDGQNSPPTGHWTPGRAEEPPTSGLAFIVAVASRPNPSAAAPPIGAAPAKNSRYKRKSRGPGSLPQASLAPCSIPVLRPFSALRPPRTSAWLAAPTALTISKMRLRTRPSRIL